MPIINVVKSFTLDGEQIVDLFPCNEVNKKKLIIRQRNIRNDFKTTLRIYGRPLFMQFLHLQEKFGWICSINSMVAAFAILVASTDLRLVVPIHQNISAGNY